MANTNLTKKENNELSSNQETNTLHYRPNEASFNYGGITLNINIPEFLENVKKIKDNYQERKGLKELKSLEQKTIEDAKKY